jgi:pilus assembly protein CpaE
MSSALVGRQVLLIGPSLDPAWSEALKPASVRLVPAEALLAGTGPAIPAALVLIDGDAADAGRLIPWLEAMAHDRTVPPLILIGARLPTRLVRAALQLPRADLLETPFPASELTHMAERLLSAVAPAPAASRCWTVIGAVGGCGATLLSAEISATLASRNPGARVCLVDLNLADGAAAAYLGATAGMALNHISDTAQIDAAVLSAFAVQTLDGFDLLAAPRDPAAFATVPAPIVTRLLEVACQTYDWVVVDLPRHRQAWTLDVIAGSDEVLVVSELTVPALMATRAQAAEIEAEAPEAPTPRIVLNRIASRLFAAAPSLAEAERAMGRRAEAGISSDWEAAAASLNLGGVVRRHRPRSKIVRDVEMLVKRMIEKPYGLGAQAAAQ